MRLCCIGVLVDARLVMHEVHAVTLQGPIRLELWHSLILGAGFAYFFQGFSLINLHRFYSVFPHIPTVFKERFFFVFPFFAHLIKGWLSTKMKGKTVAHFLPYQVSILSTRPSYLVR